MKKVTILVFCFISSISCAQLINVDLGYGFGSSAQHVNQFQVAGYPVKVELEGFVEQSGYARLSHSFIKYKILHTVSISEISFISSVASDSISAGYRDRNIYSNLSYDLTVRVFPNTPVQFICGFKSNFYLRNKSSKSPTNNFPEEVIDVSEEMEDIIQATFGYILGIQTNPMKRLMLNFTFENSFNSYLRKIEYQGTTYKTPRARIPKFSLFLTYTVFRTKTKTG